MRTICKIAISSLLLILSTQLFAQTNFSVQELMSIRNIKGDLEARSYMSNFYIPSEVPSTEEDLSFLFLWCVLTGNLCDGNDEYNAEYIRTIDSYLSPLLSDNFKLNETLVEWIPSIYFRYAIVKFKQEEIAQAIDCLKMLHSWFADAPEFKAIDEDYPAYLKSLCMLMCRDYHDYYNAIPYLDEALPLMETQFGKNSEPYIDILYFKSISLRIQGFYDQALPMMRDAISGYKQLGSISPSVIANLEYELNLTESMAQGKLPNSNIDSSENLSSLQCQQLIMEGRNEEVLPHLLRIKLNYESTSNIPELDYFVVCTMLVNAYNALGRIEEAAKIPADIKKRISLDNIPQGHIAAYYEGIGLTKYYLLDFVGAAQNFKYAISFMYNNGIKGVELSKSLSNLALCYEGLESYLNAKWYIDEACDVYEESNETLFDGTPWGMTLLNNRGMILSNLHYYDEAETLYKKVIDTIELTPTTSQSINLIYNNLANIYQLRGEWQKSIDLLEKVRSQNLFEEYQFQHNLAIGYAMIGDSKSGAALTKGREVAEGLFFNYSSYLTKNEKEKLWSNQASEMMLLNNYLAFQVPEITPSSYQNIIIAKNLGIYFDNIIKETIISSTDNTVRSLYADLIVHQDRLNKLSRDDSTYTQLVNQINTLERELLTYIPPLTEIITSKFPDWITVQSKLADDEVAIEYTVIPTVSDWSDKESVDACYGAYIITKNCTKPELIKLCDRDTLDNIITNFDFDPARISDFYDDDRVYSMVFAPLEKFLGKATTIIYSPSGAINSINIGALSDLTNRRLNERYKFRMVLTTAEIGDSIEFTPQNLVLYGGIDYDTSPEKMASIASKYSLSNSEPALLATRGELDRGNWSYLPGSLSEIMAIKGLAQSFLSTTTFSGENATEESLKAYSFEPSSILHLATHGFYIRNQEQWDATPFLNNKKSVIRKDDNLIRSGLLLSGANNIWTGKFNSIPDSEDGILTSSEISYLNLENVGLLVLSACESGRGYVDPVEGVYGLSRAFKMAGVGSILMSLWKVPDEPTSLLMESFYRHLIIDKKSTIDSLTMAQRELISRGYTSPYYWAPFVILD